MLYLIGFTKVGRRMLFQGKICPLVALGTNVLVTFHSSSTKFGGFSPAQVHSEMFLDDAVLPVFQYGRLTGLGAGVGDDDGNGEE